MSEDELAARTAGGNLLALPASDGSVLYPAQQFVDPSQPGEVLPGLAEIRGIVATYANEPLTIATWLMTPDPRLGGLSAIQWLRSGEDPTLPQSLARQDVARWQR